MKEETQKKIQELQIFEQTLHNILMQKQAFQMELTETENALGEIEKSNDDIYKLSGQIMIKANKENVMKELKQKKDILSLRVNSIDKQEKELNKNLESLKTEVMKEIK